METKLILCFTFVGAALTAALTGCDQRSNAPAATQELLSGSYDDSTEVVAETVDSTAIKAERARGEAAIRKFITSVYTNVFAAYARDNELGGFGPDRTSFDKQYLSRRKQRALGSEEIDGDYWIMAQDFTTPTFRILDVAMTDSVSGYADVRIKVFGDSSNVSSVCRVSVVRENGAWKIDEFTSL